MPTLTNWNRSAVSQPDDVQTPATVEEICELVRDTRRRPVRAAGELHSVNACFEANHGTQVLMDNFRRIKNVEPKERRITVEAGVTLLQIRDALRPHGLELAVSPEIGNATAGSLACSGTKDATLNPRTTAGLGQVGSLVVELKMVDARGKSVPVTDRDDYLRHVRSSYGLLGLIHEVTFAAVEAVPLEYRYAWLPCEAAAVPDVDTIFDGADAVLGFLQPYRKGLLVERRRKLPPDAEITPIDRVKRATRDWLWEWGASETTTLATSLAGLLGGPSAPALMGGVSAILEGVLAGTAANPLRALLGDQFLELTRMPAAARLAGLLRSLQDATPGVPPSLPASEWLLLKLTDQLPAVLLALEGFRAYRSDSMIDFTRNRATFFDFTFWAFPLSRWAAIVPQYLEFCETHTRRTGFRPSLFTEIYFICRDETSLLSFSPDGPVFTLDMVDNRPDDPGWIAMTREYNRWAAAHGGRPVLNQTKGLEATPEVVAQALGPAWTTFAGLVHDRDPQRRFLNAFFARLLGR